MSRPASVSYPQELLNLFDDLVHGRIDRRGFLQGASRFTAAGLTAEAILASLSPNYAAAQQVPKDDTRIKTGVIEYDSPKGGKKIKGLLAQPAAGAEKLPAVLVVHENRGLNPYIEDVCRRTAVAGYLALAPDGLSPLGGYPGNDDEGRTMQARRDAEEMIQDFIAAAEWLKVDPRSTGKVGVVGFCYGGGIANTLAVRIPDVIAAAAPYYGRQADAVDVPKIKAPLLIHYAEQDTRINEGWPAYEAALKANGKKYEMHMYPGMQHGFHNDSVAARYNKAAADLSWERTLAFFAANLK